MHIAVHNKCSPVQGVAYVLAGPCHKPKVPRTREIRMSVPCSALQEACRVTLSFCISVLGEVMIVKSQVSIPVVVHSMARTLQPLSEGKHGKELEGCPTVWNLSSMPHP